MVRLMIRWLIRTLLVAAASFVVIYLGDVCVFEMRGRPTASVTVERFMVVPLKGNKQEYDPMGTIVEPCSKTIFPQSGLEACWALRRHPIEYVKI